MNRIIKLTSIAMLVILFTIGLSGCFGNFAATRKLYNFNQGYSGWTGQIMFWVMGWVQIYSAVMVLDIIVFNTVEFWTGTNPIAMNSGEEVIKYASQDGKDLKITIRQNQVIVEDLDNPGQEMELSYKPMEKSWYYHGSEGLVKIATINDDQAIFHRPNGKTVNLSLAH